MHSAAAHGHDLDFLALAVALAPSRTITTLDRLGWCILFFWFLGVQLSKQPNVVETRLQLKEGTMRLLQYNISTYDWTGSIH